MKLVAASIFTLAAAVVAIALILAWPHHRTNTKAACTTYFCSGSSAYFSR